MLLLDMARARVTETTGGKTCDMTPRPASHRLCRVFRVVTGSGVRTGHVVLAVLACAGAGELVSPATNRR